MTSNPAHSAQSVPGTDPVWRGTPQPPWPAARPAQPGPEPPWPGPQPAQPGPEPPWPGPQQPQPGPQQPQPGAMQPQPGAQQPLPGAQLPWPGPQQSRPAGLTATAARADGLASSPASAAAPAAADDKHLALLGYLSVPFLGPCVPLVIYLLRKQSSRYLRRHSAQALNLSLTMILYGVCALIAGAILALDSVGVAVAIVIPLAAVLWLANAGYAFAAGLAADRGGFRRIPGWLCAALVR
jgi:uncharacterized Tic20 family protein